MYKVYEDTNLLFKILPCSLLIIFIVMCLCSPVFATDFYIEEEDYTFSVPEEWENYYYGIFFCSRGNGTYDHFSLVSSEPITVEVYYASNVGKNATRFFPNGEYYYTSTLPGTISAIQKSINSYTLSAKTPSSLTTSIYTPATDYLANGFCLSNHDILLTSGDIAFPGPVKDPYIINTAEELSTANFNYLQINSGDYTDDLYLLSFDYTNSEDVESLYPKNEILLNMDSEYYAGVSSNLELLYGVPQRNLGIDLKER